MSLILDALNKADNERNQNNTPSINSNHDTFSAAGGISNNQKLALLASIAAILLAVALILFLSLSPSAPPAAPLSASPVQTQKQSTALNKQQQAQVDVRRAAMETQAKPRKIDALKERLIAAQYQQARDDEEKIASTASADNGTKSATKSAIEEESTQQVLSIYEQEAKPALSLPATPQPTVAVVPIAQVPVSRPTPRPRITPDPSETLAKHSLLTFVSDLPYSLQKTIPTIMYTRHKYRQGGDSFVRLNNVEFRPGQQVTDKVYLEEVLHDGIVMRYNNRKFKMKALNSWVNM